MSTDPTSDPNRQLLDLVLLAEQDFVRALSRYRFATHQDACAGIHLLSNMVDELCPRTIFDQDDVEEGAFASDHLRLDFGRRVSITITAVERLLFITVTYHVTRDGHEMSLDAPIRIAAGLASGATLIAEALAMFAKEKS